MRSYAFSVFSRLSPACRYLPRSYWIYSGALTPPNTPRVGAVTIPYTPSTSTRVRTHRNLGDFRITGITTYPTDVEPGSTSTTSKPGIVRSVTPELSAEIPLDPLRQLRDLNRSSPQFNSHLAKFLDRKEYIRALPNLCNEDLVWLAEYLDRVSF